MDRKKKISAFAVVSTCMARFLWQLYHPTVSPHSTPGVSQLFLLIPGVMAWIAMRTISQCWTSSAKKRQSKNEQMANIQLRNVLLVAEQKAVRHAEQQLASKVDKENDN